MQRTRRALLGVGAALVGTAGCLGVEGVEYPDACATSCHTSSKVHRHGAFSDPTFARSDGNNVLYTRQRLAVPCLRGFGIGRQLHFGVCSLEGLLYTTAEFLLDWGVRCPECERHRHDVVFDRHIRYQPEGDDIGSEIGIVYGSQTFVDVDISHYPPESYT